MLISHPRGSPQLATNLFRRRKSATMLKLVPGPPVPVWKALLYVGVVAGLTMVFPTANSADPKKKLLNFAVYLVLFTVLFYWLNRIL
jgi:hypothetical protein